MYFLLILAHKENYLYLLSLDFFPTRAQYKDTSKDNFSCKIDKIMEQTGIISRPGEIQKTGAFETFRTGKVSFWLWY